MYKFLLASITILLPVFVTSQCTPPANSQDLLTRADAASIMAYVKIINIVNYDTESYGTTYSAYAELICSLKTDRGTILPEFFTINDLGDRPEGCPSRTVNLNEDYVIFLTKTSSVIFTVNEVNGQSGVIPGSWDNMQTLTSYVQSCLTGNCRPDIPSWVPMSESDRAELAEIIVWVKVTKKSDYGSQGYYLVQAENKCSMKLPTTLESLPSQINVTNVGALEGLCEDRHVSEGHEFIMFLAREFAYFPLPGQTIPPLQLNNYVLGLDEVNSQHAIFNVTSQVKELFKDYLVDCENAALLPSGSVFAFAASALLVLTNLFL